MRKLLIIYALIFSVISCFSFISLVAHSETMVDVWEQLSEEEPELSSWTLNAANVSRLALICPGLLFILSLLSLREGIVPEKILLHGIFITATVLAVDVFFAVAAGMMPMFTRPPLTLMHP